MRIGVSLGLYSSSWKLAPMSRFYYEHSLKSRSRPAAILEECEVFLFLGIIFFCLPQPYAVSSCKTVEEPCLDHSSLRAENAYNTLMQTLILSSNAQPATLALVRLDSEEERTSSHNALRFEVVYQDFS